jgi:DNA-binding NarL/FixJ family response regulator
MSVRVLIADDQELVRTGLRMILDAQPDIEVVGEASDGAEAIALAHSIRPDVCLIDIRMPGVDGLAATRALAGPGVADPIPVVVVTTFDLDEYVYEALRSGARGFLLKNAGPALLREAIHAAARGDALIDPKITVRLIETYAQSAPVPSTPPSAPLTDREEQVLAAVARGLGNSEIGHELHISLSTVKTHLESIMTKVDARNRVELAIWASERGRRPSSTPGR